MAIKQPAAKLPRILTLQQLRELPPPNFLSDTRLVSHGVNVVFGPPEQFKSFYAVDNVLRISRTEPVIYIAAEGAPGYSQRIDAWCEHFQTEQPDKRLWFIPEEINLLDTASIEATVKSIHTMTKKVELLVIDTYARCLLGGSDNDPGDTNTAVYHCAKLQRYFDCTLLVVHHTNATGLRERGHTGLRGGVDQMIKVTADDAGLVRIECDKIRDMKHWPDQHYQFTEVGLSGILLPTEHLSSEKLTKKDIQLLEFLSLEAFQPRGAKVIQISRALNIPESTVYKTLSKLEQLSHVVHENRGDPFRLTEIGKAALSQTSLMGQAVRKVLEQYKDEVLFS